MCFSVILTLVHPQTRSPTASRGQPGPTATTSPAKSTPYVPNALVTQGVGGKREGCDRGVWVTA